MDDFKCPYCGCEKYSRIMNLDPHPHVENWDVHVIYDCRDCGKEIKWPKDKKKEEN